MHYPCDSETGVSKRDVDAFVISDYYASCSLQSKCNDDTTGLGP